MIFLKPMRNFNREWAWVNAELGNNLAKTMPFFAFGRGATTIPTPEIPKSEGSPKSECRNENSPARKKKKAYSRHFSGPAIGLRLSG
jgi:hypothetical protein